MVNNPYRKAVNIGGAVIGIATVAAVGFAAANRGIAQPNLLGTYPNPGLHDGVYRVAGPCEALPFCPLRTLTIDVVGGQIAGIDVAYHDINRQSHSRNTPAVRALTNQAIQNQSAENLDFVSGATVTSAQFVESLQAAINAARG